MIIRCIPWLPDTTFFHPDFRPPPSDSRGDPDEAGRWSPRIRLQPQCEQVSDAFYKVESFGRTLYHLMGVDPDTIVTTPTNRPVRLIVEDAPLIREAIV